jgi:tRNA A58 N-methylase Trm61
VRRIDAAGWGRAVRHAVAAAMVMTCGGALAAQLAPRPADEWAKALESPERVAGLHVEEVVARLALKPGETVADLGAGSGIFEPVFARAVAPATVYAVDVDEKLFPFIQQKAKAANLANVVTVLGAFADPRLPVTDVDVAFLHDVLHHIEQRADYVKALSKYLKPSARIAIIDYLPERSPHRDTPALLVSTDQARALLAAAGFSRVEEVPLFSDKWFLVFRR